MDVSICVLFTYALLFETLCSPSPLFYTHTRALSLRFISQKSKKEISLQIKWAFDPLSYAAEMLYRSPDEEADSG